MEAAADADWQWKVHMQDANNKTVSRIYAVLPAVNIFNRQDWPAMISFFKKHLIAMDAFWNDVKYGFED